MLEDSYISMLMGAGSAELAAPPTNRRTGVRTRLHHDFETYSEIDVRKVGADVYSRHPSTEILMTAYTFDNEEDIRQWVPLEGEPMPAELEDALLDERITKIAWNKTFEWSIWKNVWGIEIPHEQWRDAMVLSFALSLPGRLEKAGEVVELGDDTGKMSEGTALIRLFSSPRKPTKNKPWTRTLPEHEPARWDQFKQYNRRDVVAERAIWNRLKPYDLPDHEWALWHLDQRINSAGLPINMRTVDNIVTTYKGLVSNRLAKIKEITGLANPNSGAQLLPWLKDEGYPFDDLVKGHVKRGHARAAGEQGEDSPLAQVLALRQETARNSPKKYAALQRIADRTSEPNVIRNTLQFAGAGRTWRWAGRGFQAQNLPRPSKHYEKWVAELVARLEFLDWKALDLLFDDPMEALVSCIRSVAQAPDGYVFIDADLNAIENRVLGWIADCRRILRVFELGRDPYIDFATHMYKQPYDALLAEYKSGNSSKRTVSKPAVLGCGYQLGPGEVRINHKTKEEEATGLLGYAWNMGIRLTPEEAKESVEVWRATFPEVVSFWHDIERAAKKAIRTSRAVEFRMFRFDQKGPFLRMHLPSGRALHYCRPRIEPVKTPWGEMRDQLTYEGLNDKNQWVRISTHGGKLTENGDQAIARDLLAHGLRLADREGIDLRLHVHDQIVALAPEDDAERQLKLLQDCMCVRPRWGKDLPLASNGFISKVFLKD